MEELFDRLVKYCNDYIRDNPFLSVILFGVLTNLLTDIVKSALTKSVASSVILSKFLSNRLLLRGIKGYELQLKEIEKYRKDPLRVMSEYLSYLYQNFFYFIFIVTVLYILTNFYNDKKYLFSFYGASASMVFRIVFGTIVYSSTLDNLLHRIDKYESGTKAILDRLNKLKNQKESNPSKSQINTNL